MRFSLRWYFKENVITSIPLSKLSTPQVAKHFLPDCFKPGNDSFMIFFLHLYMTYKYIAIKVVQY